MRALSGQLGPALVLGRKRSEMQRLSDWLDLRFEALGLSGKAAYAVRLCLEEAVLNVIVHGAGASGIAVALEQSEYGVVARVEDDGPAFDPLAFAPRPNPRSVDEAAGGGFGIKLIRQHATSLTYGREDGVNRLVLHFDP